MSFVVRLCATALLTPLLKGLCALLGYPVPWVVAALFALIIVFVSVLIIAWDGSGDR